MNQDKINQLNAAKTTVSYCEATAAETVSNTNFAPKVVVIKGKIVAVEGFIQLSDAPISGVTLNVKGIRAASIEQVLPLGSAVFAYGAAQTPPDQDLMALAKMVKTDLEQGSKEICFNECQRIVTLANANAANILPFGITALMLTDAQTIVTLYGNVINSPRAAIISRASAGEQAVETLASIMNIDLELHLDPMANILRFSKNVWWRAYKASREVIDLGTTFTKLRVDCVDIEGDPVQGVIVSMLQAGVVIYTKKTDAGGKASIVKVQPGDYDIRFEKTGFTTQTEVEFHFAPGSEKIHHITLLATGSGGDPAGFEITEFHIPGGGSILVPFSFPPPNPIPLNVQIYMLCTNGNAVVCTTDLPANPCTLGFQLQLGVPYQGPLQGLGLDFTKTNLQFTNPGSNDITIRAGVQE